MNASHSASSAAQGVFVTGTDTGIGKTFASCALLGALRARGIDAVGMKPVASGCRETPHGLRNDDAEALIAAAGVDLAYADANPCALAEPVSPHIAAAAAGQPIALEPIHAAWRRLRARAGYVVVEGVGGWAAPLGEGIDQAAIVHALDLPVVLVVGLRLGCLSHALLSARAIVADGCRLAGWIGNRIDPPMLRAAENLATLRERLPAPLLGVLEHAGDGDAPAPASLALEPLLAPSDPHPRQWA